MPEWLPEHISVIRVVAGLGILGAAIVQNYAVGTVELCMESYVLDAGRRFDLHNDNSWADIPVPLQLARECKAAQPTDAEVLECGELYRIMCGVATHIATFGRPDLAFASHYVQTSRKDSYAAGTPCSRLRGRWSGLLSYASHTVASMAVSSRAWP